MGGTQTSFMSLGYLFFITYDGYFIRAPKRDWLRRTELSHLKSNWTRTQSFRAADDKERSELVFTVTLSKDGCGGKKRQWLSLTWPDPEPLPPWCRVCCHLTRTSVWHPPESPLWSIGDGTPLWTFLSVCLQLPSTESEKSSGHMASIHHTPFFLHLQFAFLIVSRPPRHRPLRSNSSQT